MTSLSGPTLTRTTSFETPMDKKCASVSTSVAVQPAQEPTSTCQHKTGSTPALSAVTSPTTLFRGLAAPTLEDFLKVATPPTLSYPQFSAIHCHPAFDRSIHSFPDIFDTIILPYNANTFEALLQKYNLLNTYPNLVSNLQHGFPLGDQMPNLSLTHIIPNHPSFFDHPHPIAPLLPSWTSNGGPTN
jgi:hypothetical protein